MAAGGLTGPGLQLVVTLLGPDGVTVAGFYKLNLYNAPALIASLLNVCGFLTIFLYFEENYEVMERDLKEARTKELWRPYYTQNYSDEK
ncbi:unnamed protein product [Strongylus vulgaris]|uniref:Uncharacterized protein n=1 Tax=Strongylus vulgaris TaxID=40348 RepID=A0A3P7JGR3_STRVU|nr:unnamed protein product [Strongylus vulgaris]